MFFFIQPKEEEVCNMETLSVAETSKVLTDTFRRPHNYLRISLSERCNLRCKQQVIQFSHS